MLRIKRTVAAQFSQVNYMAAEMVTENEAIAERRPELSFSFYSSSTARGVVLVTARGVSQTNPLLTRFVPRREIGRRAMRDDFAR